MIKKTITFTDYNGNEKTKDYYFNLTKAEIAEMYFSESGSFVDYIRRIVESEDGKKIIEVYKELLLKSYGEKSLDGEYFMKSDEMRKKFACSEAYSKLFMELATDDKAAAEFINGVVPKSVADKAKSTESSNAIEPQQ